MTSQSTSTKRGVSKSNFFRDSIAELKKVVWLSRQEVIYLSALVLVVSIIAAIMLGVIDYGFTRLINNIFLGGL